MAQPFLSPLPQAKRREDEQNHDNQADEINQTIHGALPKLPLSPVATRKRNPLQERKFRGRLAVKGSAQLSPEAADYIRRVLVKVSPQFGLAPGC
jgi:hypothetical protein